MKAFAPHCNLYEEQVSQHPFVMNSTIYCKKYASQTLTEAANHSASVLESEIHFCVNDNDPIHGMNCTTCWCHVTTTSNLSHYGLPADFFPLLQFAKTKNSLEWKLILSSFWSSSNQTPLKIQPITNLRSTAHFVGETNNLQVFLLYIANHIALMQDTSLSTSHPYSAASVVGMNQERKKEGN